MVVRLEKPQIAESLFGDWQETIIWSCIQNIMGDVYADNTVKPTAAVAVLGDFGFLAGEPNEDLVNIINSAPSMRFGTIDKVQCWDKDFMIMVPQNAKWAEMIEACYREKAKAVTRYAVNKNTEFNKNELQIISESLSDEYELRLIDKECFDKCMQEEWSKDLVSQFTDYETYQKLGIGVAALKGEKLVSGASSYSRYDKGIEIEVDTHKEYRRKGLACACGARLILECLKRGLYPSWDAQNLWSVALAEKLGYCYDYSYAAYEVCRNL